jgi:hypothetical protein
LVVPRARGLFAGEIHVITSYHLAYRNADETMMLLPSHVEETTTEQLPR